MSSLLKDLIQSLRLAIPIIVGQLTQVVLQITDALMIGRLGATPLAASAFAFSLFAIFMVFSIGFSACISTLVAQHRGAGQPRLMFESFRHGLILSLFFGVLSGLILLSLVPVLGAFGQAPDVTEMVGPYLVCLALSCVPMALQNAFRQFSEGLERVAWPMWVALGGVLLNILLNALLIYGLFGFPRLELFGAGLATLFARLTMAIALVGLVFLLPAYRPHFLRSWWRAWSHRVALRCLRIGLPSGVQGVFEISAFAGVTILVGWFGAASLAAHQIVLNMASFTYVLTLGLGFAATLRVGYAFGQNNIEDCRRIGWGVIVFALTFMSFSGLCFFIFRKELPSLYISDPEVIKIASQLIVVAALFQIFDGVQAVCHGVLRGMGDVQVPMILCFVAYWIIGVPFALVSAFWWELGAMGCWLGLAMGLAITAVVLMLRFLRLTSSRSS